MCFKKRVKNLFCIKCTENIKYKKEFKYRYQLCYSCLSKLDIIVAIWISNDSMDDLIKENIIKIDTDSFIIKGESKDRSK